MLGAHTDITDLKETEREILRLTNEYEKVFNGTQDAMFLIKVMESGAFQYIRNNLAHINKTGIPLEQIMLKSPQELLGKALGDVVSANYQMCVDGRKSITYEENLSLPVGERIWLTTLTPFIEDLSVTHIVGSSTDITERKKLELELENYANYDKLTGLPNRRLFFERLNRMVLESERDESQFALLFMDLDGFKHINDHFGHEVGDDVLIEVGNRLLRCIRKSDTAARMGGDEFTVIIRNIGNKKNIDHLVQKIHTTLKESMVIESSTHNINASIGIALYPQDGKDSETLLRVADASMYDVKRKRKSNEQDQ